MEFAINKEGKYVLEFVSSRPEMWLTRISEKFGLKDLEKDSLLSYLNHIHPESLDSFSEKLLCSPKAFLEPFIDNFLEEFGEEMFSVEYQDLFDETVSGTRSRMILYNAFAQNLREMDKSQREEQYAILGVSFGPKDDKRARRIMLYEAFISRLKKMSAEEYASYSGVF